MLQPNQKSFPGYIRRGYEYASKEMIKDKKIINLLNKISFIDDSVLILDDIFDGSETRNGKICLYKDIGIQGAIIKAELLKTKVFEVFFNLMILLKTNYGKRLQVINLLNDFLTCIYTGEQIDLELGNEKVITDKTIKKYFEMISLFTGGHIKYSLEIGQILANKQVNKNLSKIAISLGIIRQICDDFYDYFPSHHEPFGDFKTENNRLPEILFKRFNGDRSLITNLLEKNKIDEARDIVLNDEVRLVLFNYCKKEEEKIKSIKTDFNYSNMLENFGKILTRKK